MSLATYTGMNANTNNEETKMTAAYGAQEKDSILLQKAQEFLNHSRQNENEARKELARATAQTKLAKEKHCRAEARAKRLGGDRYAVRVE